jgi:hypothetical protein
VLGIAVLNRIMGEIMSSSVGRRVIGVVVGTITALLVVGVVEAVGHRMFPPPPGLDLSNAADVGRLIETMSGSALSIVLASWFLGALIGGWVALRVSHWRVAPWIVCAVIIGGGIWSFVMIPHPLWMMAAGIVLPLLAAVLLLRRSRTGLN